MACTDLPPAHQDRKDSLLVVGDQREALLSRSAQDRLVRLRPVLAFVPEMNANDRNIGPLLGELPNNLRRQVFIQQQGKYQNLFSPLRTSFGTSNS